MASRLGYSFALTLVFTSGTVLAQASEPKQPTADETAGRLSTHVELSQTKIQSLAIGFAWQSGDDAMLARRIPITETFRAVAGSYERQAKLVAKVRDRSDMARRMLAEPVDGARSSLAQETDGARAIAAVEARMQAARDRLAPSLIEAFDDVDTHSFRLPAGWTEEEITAVLMATGDYEFVEPDWLVYPTDTTPNDPSYSNQWHHRSNYMNSVLAWDYVTGGSDIIVAVCDTGVLLTHADLAGSLLPGFNSSTNIAQADGGDVNDSLNGHGTATGGCMAAIGNNGIGVAGMGWNFSLIPIKVSNRADGVASLSDILQGARWGSDNGAFVSNCSYGGANSSQTNSTGAHIKAEGHLLTFSSGNDGIEDQINDRPHVITVGASTTSNTRANFSNYGVGIDVIAPGVSIRTTQRSGGYGNSTGTSFAAPLTAGALALIKAANPSLTNDQVEQILYDTAIDVGTTGEDNFTGHGRVRVGEAVEAALIGPSSVGLPFLEDFSSGILSNLWRDAVGVVEVNQNAPGLGVDEYAMNLDTDESISSVAFRALLLGPLIGEVSFGVQHVGVEAGESLLIEYLDNIGNWNALNTVISDGQDTNSFERVRTALPLDGKHDGLRLRFTSQASDGLDDWYIDDVLVAEFGGNELPWSTGFENGIDLDFDWEFADAAASADAPSTPQGSISARLSTAGTMQTRDIDVTQLSNTIYARVRSLHTGVEAGESLTIEFRTLSGTWQELGQVISDGNDQSSFELTQIALPFGAFSTDVALRFSVAGDETDDVWYIDDVALTQEFVVDPPQCPADLAAPFGTLNFFDVSAFIAFYNAQDSTADIASPFGTFNFFDVSAFISAYNQGCP
ncbi:MAG: S8 family serine peptidase [Phycisphaerales bacterium]